MTACFASFVTPHSSPKNYHYGPWIMWGYFFYMLEAICFDIAIFTLFIIFTLCGPYLSLFFILWDGLALILLAQVPVPHRVCRRRHPRVLASICQWRPSPSAHFRARRCCSGCGISCPCARWPFNHPCTSLLGVSRPCPPWRTRSRTLAVLSVLVVAVLWAEVGAGLLPAAIRRIRFSRSPDAGW